MKKLLSMLMAILLVAMAVGCAADTTSDSDSDVINIGVIQQMQHGSLDAAYEGFVDGLAEAGYVDGENIKINYQNASGEPSNYQQICTTFANNDTDMVLAIATNAAQAAVTNSKRQTFLYYLQQ